jgi:hypothetical protein
MITSVEELLSKIGTAQTYEDLEGWIWIAGDFIAKTTFREYNSGFPEIDAVVVSREEGEKLKTALLAALQRSSEPRFVSQILDCLMMTKDSNLKSLYVSYLEQYSRRLKDCNGVVYAALNALSRLGEDVYERNEKGTTSQSLIEIDNNIRQAHRYLANMGIKFSW